MERAAVEHAYRKVWKIKRHYELSSRMHHSVQLSTARRHRCCARQTGAMRVTVALERIVRLTAAPTRWKGRFAHTSSRPSAATLQAPRARLRFGHRHIRHERLDRCGRLDDHGHGVAVGGPAAGRGAAPQLWTANPRGGPKISRSGPARE